MGKSFNTGKLVNNLNVLDNGNVGIGVANPSTILDVVGAGGIRVNEDGAGTKVISIRSNFAGVDPAINVSTNNALLLQTNNTERMRITSSGNVGIGTNSPVQKLQIDSTSADGIYLSSFLTTSGAADTGAVLSFGFNDGSNNRDAAYIKGLKENGTSANYASYMSFFTRANGASPTERMRITSSGNVGIGTTTPDALLRIDSNVASANNTMLYLYNADYTGTTRSFVRVRNNISAGSTYSSYFGQGADRKTYIIANDTSRNDIVINGDNGYVGVGTNSPSYLLDVSGSIKAGRVVYQWYWGSWQGNNTYWHMKTNLWGGGSPNGNSQYTMSFFKGYSYSYSASILEGSCGFHNWGGAIYNYRTTGNIFSNVYVSSDGYVVLVILSGLGETGVVIDWHQHFEYPTRVCQVTAAGLHGSISGKY
jgi:hypothetical protein